MTTAAAGAIKKISLPEGFLKGEELVGGLGNNWTCKFHPQNDPEVDLSLYYRGRPIVGTHAKNFRDMLRRPPQFIFAASDFIPATELETNLVASLSVAMGNSGNNQLSNKAAGTAGSRFFLETMQIRSVKNKHALAVTGYFHDADGELNLAFRGLFYEAKPGDDSGCDVEEIFMQAPSRELLDRYTEAFEAMLATIEWA